MQPHMVKYKKIGSISDITCFSFFPEKHWAFGDAEQLQQIA